ncbi:LPS biosynthesis-modulating metalloenzyme YejM [Jinshanibacter sp. LJY008]|uniref:Inner membrane protein YejM n=1 Tax=Limnobaculum eriocheiris TaxID=2897391 RepID=A0A9X1MTX6_9GAMM|nr:LPS biosynthesis-modulating metalloenzyme YejM [Limnobaculum eriocheiris]MCD1124568.1 LPS biosynthesis-modulating metalloenzyme YejM [Limnobaculum eriocheiris]
MVTNRQQYKEKVSQMISWGHWFALFNIILSLVLSSRYLFITDWPGTLLGRIYALVSWLGHFGFITFAVYLLILFPLTFIIMSQRLMRVLSAILATAGLTLLIIDTEVFFRFRLHLNPTVWGLLINPDETELVRDWQLLFICIPVILLIELLFGTWSWQKLRSLNRQTFGKPLAAIFITAFIFTHMAYIWADANFYRPITMQRANLPLSYPMTARRFLEKYGLLDAQAYQDRLIQQGNPEAVDVEYPLAKLSYDERATKYNLLVIVVDGIRNQDMPDDMPKLSALADKNIQFTRHYSSGNMQDTGLFGLFYGISPTYIDSILAGKKSSALITALSQQNYQFGLFSASGFRSPLYRQALLSDFTLPPMVAQSNSATTEQWQEWVNSPGENNPWFSYIQYSNNSILNANADKAPTDFINKYHNSVNDIDQQIDSVMQTLSDKGLLEKTVVVITAAHGVEFNDTRQNVQGFGQNYSRYQLQVPLVIHWPGTPAQKINKMTGHTDIMATLMQRLLHVKNATSTYSQGEDLFTAQRRYPWVTAGDAKQLVVITPDETILISANGRYRTYDANFQQIDKEKPSLSLLLQVLTDVKRFMAN